MKNLVSIIIPTHNRAHFLGQTLESVLAQTYKNWECIVVDDGSTDYTPELMEFYRNRNVNIHFYSFNKSSERGAGAPRNFGFEKSKGDLIMWLDDDDLLHHDKIKQQVALAAGNAEAVMTCSWGRFNRRDDFHIKQLEIYRDYTEPVKLLKDYGSYHCFFPSHAFLVPRSVVKKAGLWRTDLAINDDGEFFVRAILAGEKILFAKDTYVMYRHHFNNKMSELNCEVKAKDLVRSWKLIQMPINTTGKDRPKEVH